MSIRCLVGIHQRAFLCMPDLWRCTRCGDVWHLVMIRGPYPDAAWIRARPADKI